MNTEDRDWKHNLRIKSAPQKKREQLEQSDKQKDNWKVFLNQRSKYVCYGKNQIKRPRHIQMKILISKYTCIYKQHQVITGIKT